MERKALIDVLMITYNRAHYTGLSLSRLLETCDDSMRVWVWHNGNDEETLSVVNSFRNHPRFHQFHHSSENRKLREPTNWFWENASGEFLSKVDDDCLMPVGWGETLRAAHAANPTFGVIGCWRFPEEDFIPEVASRKIREFNGGHRLLLNCWIEGSGYLMKRACVQDIGLLRNDESFSGYCIRLSLRGWTHGWYYPFLPQVHLDDPRSEHTLLKNDGDMKRWAPLSAINNGVVTVRAWQNQLRRSARLLQRASADPKYYSGWRRQVKRAYGFIKNRIGLQGYW